MLTINFYKKAFLLAYALIYIGALCVLYYFAVDWQSVTYKDIHSIIILLCIWISPLFVKVNGWPLFTYLRESTSSHVIANHYPGSIIIYELPNGRWHWYMLTSNFYADVNFFDSMKEKHADLLFILDANDNVHEKIASVYTKDKDELLQASILYALTVFNYKIAWRNEERNDLEEITDLPRIIEAYSKSVSDTKVNTEKEK